MLDSMFRFNTPLTRDKYLKLNYPEGAPEEWGAEHEAELPEPFQTDDVAKWPKAGDW